MKSRLIFTLLFLANGLYYQNDAFAQGTETVSFSFKGEIGGGPQIASKVLGRTIKLIVSASAKNSFEGGFVTGTIQCLGEGTKTIVAKYIPFGTLSHHYDIIVDCVFTQQ